jgi:condensin complex subunit 2
VQVKPCRDEGDQTNFQRASCTLDAGIKIYSYRVDSVHSDAFKVLGGLSRTAVQSREGDHATGDGETTACSASRRSTVAHVW